MAFEIRKLLDKQKAIATSTIRNFYLRRTTPRKKDDRRWKRRKTQTTHMKK